VRTRSPRDRGEPLLRSLEEEKGFQVDGIMEISGKKTSPFKAVEVVRGRSRGGRGGERSNGSVRGNGIETKQGARIKTKKRWGGEKSDLREIAQDRPKASQGEGGKGDRQQATQENRTPPKALS